MKYCSNENNKKGASHAARSTVVMWVSHQLGKSHWLSSSWYTMATKHFNSWLHATCKQEIATSQKGNKLVDVVCNNEKPDQWHFVTMASLKTPLAFETDWLKV